MSTVKLLLEVKADLTVFTKKGATALCKAAGEGETNRAHTTTHTYKSQAHTQSHTITHTHTHETHTHTRTNTPSTPNPLPSRLHKQARVSVANESTKRCAAATNYIPSSEDWEEVSWHGSALVSMYLNTDARFAHTESLEVYNQNLRV